MNKLKWLVLLLVLGLLAAAWGYRALLQQVNAPLNLSGPVEYTLERGQHVNHLLHYLRANDMIPSRFAPRVLVKIKPELAQVKAGTYEIEPGMSILQLLNMLVAGKEKLFSIQLVEGFRWQDWLMQIQAHPNLDGSGLNNEFVQQLDPQGGSLEGWLMPDTYHFSNGTDARKIVRQAYNRMQDFVQQAWLSGNPDLPYTTAYEALIMASIIEKETGLAEERNRIAAVFVNRLRRGMRLQTDPTVIYGMGESFDGNIRRKDLREATPYNTYVINGLPPTPIAMPSAASVMAAVNPVASDELYFVSRNDGSHVFSTNLADHNKAVRQYQLNQK
ncbi:endolytic transglycosylase MltG [Lacimicrobium alkaliphilum]|uniref:Endolytic murein transglycosylase n=1 Tax=Lacimicrobium alkaliphilum TaxID=1526571 RepID=A0ABQ1RUY6_9ALTE|nr:endolytic transglycosylase MltG [Lacimicrobium alkaliphilum]GGD78332.1 aminodeoxychorismate lyase [Lacimicrobium alkaliphilum]